MQIPSYAKAAVNAYQASGTLSGASQRAELDQDSANSSLQNLKDEFTYWKSLDESELDQLKGQPGAVRVASDYSASKGYLEANFSGNTQSGRLQVEQNDPLTHYGFASYSETRFTPQAAENLSMQYGNNTLLGPQLLHLDREFSSDGPVVLSGGPVSVTLTDKATGGYVIF